MNCDISLKNTDETELNAIEPTAGFKLLFSASIIAIPIRIKSDRLLCTTAEGGNAELHFSSTEQSFTFMRHMDRKTLLAVDICTCHRTRKVRLFVCAAEHLEKY